MKPVLSLLILLLLSSGASGQRTIFSLSKKEMSLADDHFREQNYAAALELYSHAYKKDSSRFDHLLKMIKCASKLKQYQLINTYFKSLPPDFNLDSTDLLLLGDGLIASGNYAGGKSCFKKYLAQNDNELVLKKLWQLDNIKFLLEDSAHFSLKPHPLNTHFAEMSIRPYENGLLFLSNRKSTKAIQKIDGTSNAYFYNLYFSTGKNHPFNPDESTFEPPSRFSRDLKSHLHLGPFSFYDHQRKIVFSKSAMKKSKDGRNYLQLYFAGRHGTRWVVSDFPHNNPNYTLSDPAINEDGTILFFTSDMPGGYGGKDIYRSDLVDGKWTAPVNLGATVNTSYDEGFPFWHNESQTLYFSSGGHAGLGALDIFRLRFTGGEANEIQNVGYPLNTTFDDFAFYLDSAGYHGYLSSNRNHGGLNDDLYEFDIDLQTYPMIVHGTIAYKEQAWNDSTPNKPLADARFVLTDHLRGVSVFEGSTGPAGEFSLTVPYYSQFKLRVIAVEGDEHLVSFELPKHKNGSSLHEVVILKNTFGMSNTQLQE